MKAVQSINVGMSDTFRAFAGAPEAQFDVLACAVYSAAFSIMQAGNKTQFNKLEQDAAMFGADHSDATKAIKEALGVAKVTPAVKHFRKVYFSVAQALAHMGVPAMVKDLPSGKVERETILAPLAQAYADEFTSVFVATVTMPEKTEAERAAAKEAAATKRAEKTAAAEKATAQAAKEQAADIQRAARELAATMAAPVLSLADMARAVLDALRAGTLDVEIEAELMEAAQTRETAALLALASTPATEAIPA